MYILDTDHLSVVERGGPQGIQLAKRLSSVDKRQIVTSIISYEEQIRGRLSLVKRATTIGKETEAYLRLGEQLFSYCNIHVLQFDERAAQEFIQLKKSRLRIGTMDLKIASIALANKAIILTRNTRDFEKIPGLSTENWVI